MRLFKKYISVHKPATIIYDETFYQILRETARHPIVLRMKLYPHHGTTNCYIHCLHVAYFNYKWCKALGLDYESATRAGMIHDLFLYDWHTHAKETGEYFHGLTHARRLLEMHKGIFISTQQKWISSRTICGRLRCFIFHIQKKAGSLL